MMRGETSPDGWYHPIPPNKRTGIFHFKNSIHVPVNVAGLLHDQEIERTVAPQETIEMEFDVADDGFTGLKISGENIQDIKDFEWSMIPAPTGQWAIGDIASTSAVFQFAPPVQEE